MDPEKRTPFLLSIYSCGNGSFQHFYFAIFFHYSLFSRMNWVNGTPDGSGEESIERITMLRNTLGQFVPPVCECLGLLDFNDVTICFR